MIKAIIGLGNPGPQFAHTRHNIGFMVLDALAQQHNVSWRSLDRMEVASVAIGGRDIFLIKPTTFMNNSGEVVPWLQKKGIKANEILVVHDELEFPFGKVAFKAGGSARGHNGLRSLIASMGDSFGRIRIGIGRPADQAQVSDYVLERFSESADAVEAVIAQAVSQVEEHIQ